jgi:hypothetical protein
MISVFFRYSIATMAVGLLITVVGASAMSGSALCPSDSTNSSRL